jgi:membrane protein
MKLWKKSKKAIKPILEAWQQHHLQAHAAALAFFSLMALGPVWFAGTGVLTWALGVDKTVALFEGPLRELLGGPAARSVGDMLQAAPAGRSWGAYSFGASTFVTGFYGIFSSLRTACEAIWHKRPGHSADLYRTVGRRLAAFGLLILFGTCFLVSLLSTALLTAGVEGMFEGSMLKNLGWLGLEGLLGWGLLSGACAGMLRTLPDVSLSWRDVGRAGMTMALLLTVGKWAIAFYLTQDNVSGTYGTAGTLGTLIIWLYYSAQTLLIGAVLAHLSMERREA